MDEQWKKGIFLIAENQSKNVEESFVEALEMYREFLDNCDISSEEASVVINTAGALAISSSEDTVDNSSLVELMSDWGCEEAFLDCNRLASGILGRSVSRCDGEEG